VVDILSAFPYLKDACDKIGVQVANGDCRNLVKGAIETGLASMGIPPSIPSWDQLKAQGVDYVASLIASELQDAAGIPPDLTEAELEAIVNKVIENMSAERAKLGPYDWLLPYNGFEPAVWSLTLKKDPSLKIPDDVHVFTIPNGLYEGANVLLPKQFPPNDILRIPIVLWPSLVGIAPPECKQDLQGQQSCTPNPFLPAPSCSVDIMVNGQVNHSQYPCFDQILAIYYRNAWVLKKFFPRKCTFLHAATRLHTGTLYFPWPFAGPFHDVAAVSPKEFAIWDGWQFSNCQ
jgi:hypothetical protein